MYKKTFVYKLKTKKECLKLVGIITALACLILNSKSGVFVQGRVYSHGTVSRRLGHGDVKASRAS